MTKLDLTKAFEAGELVLQMEYRTSKAETITWRDKVSKGTMTAPVLRHTVEGKTGSFAVSERVDEKTFDPAKYVPPFKKGEMVCLRFTSALTERGTTSFSGTLEKIV